jgi:peptidoglycan/LPS O-acetylase OafA/YrhL
MRANADKIRATRIPSLDGLRALAVISVVALHTTRGVKGGFIGVDVFFVLSGFLITTLLVEERDETGTLAVRAFYCRRALRLFPALGAAVVLAVVLAATVAPHVWRDATFTGIPWTLLYVGDFARSFSASDFSLGLLQHTWSLAIEEQFYLVWPLACFALLSRASRGRTALALAGLAATDMVFNFAITPHKSNLAYFTPFGHGMGLLAGAALGLALTSPEVRARAASIAPAINSSAIAATVAIIVVIFKLPMYGHRESLAIDVATLGTVMMITSLMIAPTGGLSQLLGMPPLVWVGQRSYGIYLYHYILVRALFPGVGYSGVPDKGPESPLECAFAIAVSVAVAAASFRFLERPFLKLKSRLAVAHVVPTADLQPSAE